MRSGPGLNRLSGPDPSDRQVCFRHRKIVVRGDDLMHSLLRHAEHLGDLRNAHEVACHAVTVTNTCDDPMDRLPLN